LQDKGAIEDFIHNTSSTSFTQWRQLCIERVKEYVKTDTVKPQEIAVQPQVITTDTTTRTVEEILNGPITSSVPPSKLILANDDEPVVKEVNKLEIETEKVPEKVTERESDDDGDYFDAPEQVHFSGNGFYPLINVLQTELSQVKSLSTITYSRLCRIESTLSTDSHKSTTHNIDVIMDKLGKITNRQNELERQIKERDDNYRKRFEELERNTAGRRVGNWVSGGIIVIFLILWPYFAVRMWSRIRMLLPIKIPYLRCKY